ncbi:MAG: hypothetical protein FJX77_01790 [Armatimonadetes bacterium]|nr:hypothetical protein [Armatimonadota bacterium]
MLLWEADAPGSLVLDERTDLGVLSWAGSTEADGGRRLRIWRDAGYRAAVALSLTEDAGSLYSSGSLDGMAHPGEVATDGSGLPIAGLEGPFLFPSAGWQTHLTSQTRRAVEGGVEAITLDQTRLPLAAGHSLAFRAAWEAAFKSPWQAPDSSPTVFFRGSRLKSDLILRSAEEVIQAARSAARERGRPLQVYLPLHSPLAAAEAGFLSPAAALSRLPVDHLIGRLGPAPVSSDSFAPTPFEAGWAHSSYLANLVEELPERRLYFAPWLPPAPPAPAPAPAAVPGAPPTASTATQPADPQAAQQAQSPAPLPPAGRPAAGPDWRDPIVASLLFPRANGYSIAMRGAALRAGALEPPAPRLPEGLTALLPGLRDASGVKTAYWIGGTRSVGILTLDTLPWQKGGPQGGHTRSHWGLLLPLLRRGISAELVPMERVGEPAFLARFKVLVVSYDMQKPLVPALGEALARWVQAGGVLVVFGGEDSYNRIEEWWERDNLSTPTDHLLRECALAVEPRMRSVHVGGNRFSEVLRGDQDSVQRHTIPLRVPGSSETPAGAPLFVRFAGLGDGGPGKGARVGRIRIREGERVRADFAAGSVAEKPFLVEEHGAARGAGFREVRGDGAFVYQFRRLGPNAVLEAELSQGYRVSLAGGGDPALVLQPAGLGSARPVDLPQVRLPSRVPLASYPLMGAQPLYQIHGESAVPAWFSPARAGWVYYCGVPAALGAESESGADLVRNLVRLACTRAGIGYTEGPLLARRGSYLIGHPLGRKTPLKGAYVDLLDPELPLLVNPELSGDRPVLYKEVALLSRSPLLLYGSYRTQVVEAFVDRMRLKLQAPAETPVTLRIYLGGMGLANCRIQGEGGTRLRAQDVGLRWRVEGRTLQVRVEKPPRNAVLRFTWLRPEARFSR